MKNFQTVTLLSIIILLIAYTVYGKLVEKYDFSYKDHTAYQVYLANVERPTELYFAGEKVPLNDKNVYERFDREMYINTYWFANTVLMMKRANRWLPMFEKILKKHEVPTDFKYLPIIESGLTHAISPAGAVGYWQLMEGTAKEMGLEITSEVDERYHPIKSTEAAAKYLKLAYADLKNWANVTASYNMGINGIKYSLQSQRVSSYYDLHLNQETARYVFRAIAIKEVFEHSEKYGYKLDAKTLYTPQEELKEILITETIPDLIAFAIEQGITLKVLKEYNPWLRANSLTIKDKNKTYTFLIPQGYKPSGNILAKGDSLKKDSLSKVGS